MHEYSIVQSLVDSVAAAVEPLRGAAVRRVHVAIGELAGVDRGLLLTAYEVFREGTICETAELNIEPVTAAWECPRCREAIERGGFLRCGRCGAPARLAMGDDIILQRIELEVV